jgi:hypothetical protein
MEMFWRKYGNTIYLLFAVMLSSTNTDYLHGMFAAENEVLYRTLAVVCNWFLLTALFSYAMNRNQKIE